MHTGQYGSMNKTDTTRIGYYVVNYVSDEFTLQEYINTDDKVSKAGKLTVISKYCISMKKI